MSAPAYTPHAALTFPIVSSTGNDLQLQIRVYRDENQRWLFCANDLADAMNYKNPSSQLHNARTQCAQLGAIPLLKIERMNYLTEEATTLFLSHCGKHKKGPEAQRLITFLEAHTTWRSNSKLCVLGNYEGNTLACIKRATYRFAHEINYAVKGGKTRYLDLYFPNERVAIECDEQHEYYDADDEAARTALIEQQLPGVRIYRYRRKDADLFRVCGDILHLLYSTPESC